MKKKICLLLAAIMILALVGCNVSDNPTRRYTNIEPYTTDYTYRDNNTGRVVTPKSRYINPADAPPYGRQTPAGTDSATRGNSKTLPDSVTPAVTPRTPAPYSPYANPSVKPMDTTQNRVERSYNVPS